MTQVRNTGQVAISYRGGYIFPGRVKDVAEEDIDTLREQGDIIVLPTQKKSRRPSPGKKEAVAGAPPPDKKEEVASKGDEGKPDGNKGRRKQRKTDRA